MSRHQLHVWIMLVLYPSGLVFFSTALAFLTNMSEKRKSASRSAIQVKNRRRTVGIDEKLRVIMRRDKGQRIDDICHHVRLTHSSIHTIRGNADRVDESSKSGTKVVVCVERHHSLIQINRAKNYGRESLTFLLYYK
jgi:hypothetical protein